MAFAKQATTGMNNLSRACFTMDFVRVLLIPAFFFAMIVYLWFMSMTICYFPRKHSSARRPTGTIPKFF